MLVLAGSMDVSVFYDVRLMKYVTGCEKESRQRMGSHIYKEKFFSILEISVTSPASCEGVSSRSAYADPRSGLKPGQVGVILSNKLLANRSNPAPNHKLCPVRRISPLRRNNQPRRCFTTAATGAFSLLKVIK